MNRLKFSLAALLLISNLNAKEAEVELKEVTVSGEAENDPLQKKVAETTKTAKTMEKQQVQDTRDLVKYETGVTVVETGRMGASGYSIRGVDENRVAISIDGLQQAETLSSQGFRELFDGYGNFNNTRNGVEIENVKQATITKGADSIKTGSGALGGSVMFETKDARDFLTEKDYYYSGKRGYSSANNQDWQSHTLAGRFKWFDVLAIKTKRKGHEIENYGYRHYDALEQGKRREKADPYRIIQNSTLLKFAFSPNETNRFTFMSDKSKTTAKGHDFSYTLKYLDNLQDLDEQELRHTNDESSRRNYAIGYENYDETPFWDSLKITASKQKIKLRARTDDYCDGNEKCNGVANPAGLEFKNGKVVDKYGGDVTLGRDSSSGGTTTLTDSRGNVYKNESPRLLNDTWFDCSIFDCNSPVEAHKLGWNDQVATKTMVNLDKRYTDANGKTYASASSANDVYIPFPSSPGFLENNWKERDLNTETKNLSFEATKEFTTKGIEHALTYGAIYDKTEKSMVNKQGYGVLEGSKVEWWAKRFLGFDWYGAPNTCESGSGYNAYLCPRNEPLTSFLIPTKTKTGAFYIGDEIRINDYVGIGLNYRYDRIKHKPYYNPGSTPKIPDDMVKGLFVPLQTNELVRPNWWDDKYPGGFSDPQYQADLAAYNARQAEVDAANETNAADNIKYIARSKKFAQNSYALSATFDPWENFRIQTKYAKGFRAPTSDEMYFTFKHPDFTVLPNPDLDSEIAKTKEIAFTLHESPSFVTLNLFETKYTNFIDIDFLGRATSDSNGNLKFKRENGKIIPDSSGSGKGFLVYQNINRSNAVVRGFEINSKLFLDQIYEPLSGFSVGYKFTYQKGRIKDSNGDRIPMNAVQPTTSVYSLGYLAQSKKFGVDLYITNVAAKKESDTYNMYWKEEGKTNSYVKWRSASYTTADVIAFYSPIKYLTFRAGVYNIMDKEYLTWENARSIRPFGTSNMIDQDTGKGIARFYSPGRNFKLTFEFTF